MKKLLLLSLLLISSYLLSAQDRQAAYEMNERLGRGMNMGNAFEAPSEESWGNPWKPEYFSMISELGFTHVRLPIRWEPANRSMATAPYTIYPEFLERIKTVIDEALKNKLHIIINMHHHEDLIANPTGQKERFLSQWRQIADYFKSYPDSLLFEVLNEPNGKLTPELWNQFAADAVSEIRKTNPDRTIMLGTAEWGGIGGLNYLQLPNDDNIIVAIHYYNPFEFTHQGAEWTEPSSPTGVKWHDTEDERKTMQNEFKTVKEFSVNNNIPVHIGEFGSYSKADIDSRVRWTTYLARWFEEQGYSWAYWEFSAGFGIYNPATGKFSEPLVNALLHNLMPEPAKVEYSTIYKSNFENNTDGWALYTQSPASGVLSNHNNQLEATVTVKGSEGWHLQLVKNGIPLEEDEMYRFSFITSSSVQNNFVNYIGRNSDPWNAYSGYNSVNAGTQEEKLTYTFTMKQPDDASARIVFDIGTINPSTVVFKEITVDKIKITPTSIQEVNSPDRILFYPNPVNNELFVDNNGAYNKVTIYSLGGNKLTTYSIYAGKNRIDMNNLKPGVYLISFEGDTMQTKKLIKK